MIGEVHKANNGSVRNVLLQQTDGGSVIYRKGPQEKNRRRC